MLEKNTTSRRQPSDTSDPAKRLGRTGHYRLREVHNGKVAFAEVRLRLEPSQKSGFTVNKSSESSSATNIPIAWSRAALRGAKGAMSFIHKHGLVDGSWQVLVENVIGSISDTTSDAVECASGMALWSGLIPQHKLPEIDANGRLRVKWSNDAAVR